MTETRSLAETTLRIVRVFKAPRQRVFDAFVDPAALRVWFCPDGFEFEDITIEPTTGRGDFFAMVHGATRARYTWNLEYTLVDPPRRLEWTSIWRDGFPERNRKTFVVVDFQEVGGGTEVTLTHDGFIDSLNRDDHGRGWGGGLDKLAQYLGRSG